MIGSLTGACRIVNDRLKSRLPINIGLLEILLFEDQQFFNKSLFLETLYKAILAIAYYGLLRIGEITHSPHVVKAKDVHAGLNKNKILLIFYTSKTHNLGTYSQEVKIASSQQSNFYIKCNFCPFKLIRNYMTMRGGFKSDSEQFFLFSDGSDVYPHHVHKVL